MNIHVMLDLETLAATSNAHILSIGAVAFDPYTDAPMLPFYTTMTTGTQPGADVAVDTVAWWAQQSDSARRVFADAQSGGAQYLSSALKAFTAFVNGLEFGVEGMWGNGADFDNVILGNAYRRTGMSLPWNYGKNRCFRTLKNLALPKAFVKPERAGTHHNALDDAVYQAEYLRAIVKALNIRV